MHIRTVPAMHGLQWIAEGWALYRHYPVTWGVITLCYLSIILALSIFGPLQVLLGYALLAGIISGCDQIRTQNTLQVRQLFAGFKVQPGRLIALGGITLVIYIMSYFLGTALWGEFFIALEQAIENQDNSQVQQLLQTTEAWTAMGFMSLGYVLLMMLTWFAPALVQLNGMAPLPAMRDSMIGITHNLRAFLVYLIAIISICFAIFLTIFSVIAAGLSNTASSLATTLVILLAMFFLCTGFPLMFTITYASYRDIFRAADPT